MLDLKDIKGVGNATIPKLNELGIESVFGLFSYLPRKYVDLQTPISIKDAEIGQYALFDGRVEEISEVAKFGKQSFYVTFSDNIANNKIKFKSGFYNMPFLHDKFEVGDNYRILAKRNDSFYYEISNPQLEKSDEVSKLQGIYTIYPLRGVIGLNTFKNIISSALDIVNNSTFEGPLTSINRDIFAIFNRIHKPKSVEEGENAINDLASIDLAISLEIYRKTSKIAKKERKVFYKSENSRINDFKNALSFDLTTSQENAINEIIGDLNSNENMSRIISGDVGSGKTVVAFAAMYFAYLSSNQSVLMAPTEILAQQHAKSFEPIAKKLGVSYALLTSSTPRMQRDFILKGLENGSISCLIGTQAVLSDNVNFKSLSLAIIDEQHRFGVHDRGKLEEKGACDVLSMTATPIPRSMALTFYSDIAISKILKRDDAKTNVSTYVFNDLDKAVRVIYDACAAKKQSFVVCPSIEDSEGNVLFSIKEFQDKYEKGFNKAGYVVEYLHGKMSSKEKDEIMNRYINKEIDVLVSTTVIEVGIDTKASQILIINADRFGLASLHQLRGRVGRDGSKANCILHSSIVSNRASKRLDTLVKSNDGQYLAEVDFEMRGPGDFLGTSQSGTSLTPMFNLNMNASVLSNAKKYADTSLKELSLSQLFSLTRQSKDKVLNFIEEIQKVTLNS